MNPPHAAQPPSPHSGSEPGHDAELARQLARRTLELVDVASVSGQEEAIAAIVAAQLGQVSHLQVMREGNAVVARTELGRAGRVIIAGHLDTVPVTDNLPGRIEPGPDGAQVWGRGSVDMKGGLAVMLAAATSLSDPGRDVTWVFYDCEEVEATRNGLGRLAARNPQWLSGDMAVLCEPTSGRLEGGCNGTLRFELRLRGTAAHSARAWMGHNAIHDAAAPLVLLAGYRPRTVTVDGLVYREGLNAVAIGGGVAGNVIPDLCTVTINYRFAPDQSAEQAQQTMRELFAGYELTFTDVSGGARPGLDAAPARELAAAAAAHGAGEPVAKEGWTDVARFTDLGIPAVNFGPGDPALAHRSDEACPVADLVHCYRVLVDWLRQAPPQSATAGTASGRVEA